MVAYHLFTQEGAAWVKPEGPVAVKTLSLAPWFIPQDPSQLMFKYAHCPVSSVMVKRFPYTV